MVVIISLKILIYKLALHYTVTLIIVILVLDEVIQREVVKGFTPDICEGRAYEVIDQWSNHSKAWLPRHVYQAIQHTF